jgi:TrmH family RNA methyltransferase
MIKSITSRDNSLLRLARAVRDGKDVEYIFVEGLRLCAEALRSALEIEAVIVSEELLRKERAAAAIAELAQAAQRSGSVSEKLLESISYTKTPQGIVVLHQINNPVNVGAILRTAEAAGASGVITTRNTSDPLSPKSLRGAMGSAFRLPIWTGPAYEEMIEWCRKRKIQTVCADAAAPLAHTEFDWNEATALVLGPESTGLTEAETKSAGQVVSIPMHGAVESLNVSVAAGILLFEAARQRSHR